MGVSSQVRSYFYPPRNESCTRTLTCTHTCTHTHTAAPRHPLPAETQADSEPPPLETHPGLWIKCQPLSTPGRPPGTRSCQFCPVCAPAARSCRHGPCSLTLCSAQGSDRTATPSTFPAVATSLRSPSPPSMGELPRKAPDHRGPQAKAGLEALSRVPTAPPSLLGWELREARGPAYWVG